MNSNQIHMTLRHSRVLYHYGDISGSLRIRRKVTRVLDLVAGQPLRES